MPTACPEIISPLWDWYPYVGTFIAILAVLGVVVPWVSKETTRRAWKIFWSTIFVLLVLLEIRSIRLDSRQHDRDQARAQCLQLEGFKKIGEGIELSIKTSQEQFATTVDKLNQNIATEIKTFEQTRPIAFVSLQDIKYLLPPVPERISAQVFYKNSGTDSARYLWKFGKIYVAPEDIESARKIIEPDFEKAFDNYKKSVKPQLVLVAGEPQLQNINSTLLTSTDLHDIAMGKSQIYTVFRIQFSDHVGIWISDDCERTDNAAKDLPRTITMNPPRHCRFFNEARYKPKR
jgi:hypothetical protein